MKNSKKVFDNAGQSTIEVKKSQKHDANLQKNSTLYFQIGLILCLLGTYALFEMQFQDKKIILSQETANVEKVSIEYVEPFIVEVIKPKDPEPAPSKDLTDVYKEVKDDTPIIEKIINTPDAPDVSPEPVEIGDIHVAPRPKDPVIVDFIKVEVAPIYPGCEKFETNSERKKCMSKKITKLVGKKFNTNIANQYGISGLQKIQTQFTVDKNGNVTDIKIRGPHPALEKEAKRVIDKIPHMKPGYQRNTPVGVIYTLPIKFEVRN
ncbi:energy transducer TonB [Winogradskyella flava]|uniref:Energy transducer TonB n=1 Tax=Winogradskyella flava TaxID=1884876 RepID=A0A842ILA7_9FLAO|nr:energy transducer TonB [Winogradskyella flava]MBC2843481.1 energy transducer TonB [Winogradskyella flava]